MAGCHAARESASQAGAGAKGFTDEDGGFVGMDSFGASAPAGKLYEAFSITPGRIAAVARLTPIFLAVLRKTARY